MPLITQNGNPAIFTRDDAGNLVAAYDSPLLTHNPVVPGTAGGPGVDGVRVLGGLRAGDVCTVLLYFAARWHAEVEPLQQTLGVWGYDFRVVRGENAGGTISDHGGGEAADFNASQHPIGTDPRDTFTIRKIATIRRIRDDCRGVVYWGGDFEGRKDGMHVGVNVAIDSPELRQLAADIRGGRVPHVHPDLLQEDPDMALSEDDWKRLTAALLHNEQAGAKRDADHVDARLRQIERRQTAALTAIATAIGQIDGVNADELHAALADATKEIIEGVNAEPDPVK